MAVGRLLLTLLWLLDQISLILKLFLECDWKLSVGRIQTGHKYFLHPQVCGRSWRGWRFLWLHLSPSIHSLDWRQFLNFDNFLWIVGDWFINITEDCSLFWVSRFIIITEYFSFCWVYIFIKITEEIYFSGVLDKHRTKGHQGPLG